LDSLPFPARHLIPMEKYNFYVRSTDGKSRKAQNIMTSRGCPFNCYFCATPVNWGRRVRGHSPERVLEEIEHLIDVYGAEFIWFYDDTFNYNSKRVHTIMDKIIERNLNIKFCSEFRIDLVDRPLLEKMVKAGLVWGHFGIEAGSARIRREIVKKEFDIEKAFQFVRWAKELGFVPNAFFIFSHFTEDKADAGETIRIMEKLKKINPETEFSTALLHVYPGTELEKIAKKRSIIPSDFSWSRKADMRKVHVLPAAQGYVPLFKDRLSWLQIADLVMRWSAEGKKVLSGSKLKEVLREINSFQDIYVNFVFFLMMMRYKIRSFFSGKKKTENRRKKPEMRVGH
ncbi:MAG: B12-binding domain-containing radical SAM protein, partial [Candidatus Aminicenantes bacterium]|nr:B12-binding domain-containing radical SAM protein [Candidatus Aminicenantes bacterium]